MSCSASNSKSRRPSGIGSMRYDSRHKGDKSGNSRFEHGEITIGACSASVMLQGKDVHGNGLDTKATPPEPSEFAEVSGHKIPFRLV